MSTGGSITQNAAATVGDLVQGLQKTSPDLNILQAKGVAEVPLTDFKLRGVSASTMLGILSRISDYRVRLSGGAGPRSGGRGGGAGGGGGFGGPPFSGADSIYMLDLVSEAERGARPSPRKVAVFNISGYLASLADRGVKSKEAVTKELTDLEQMIVDTLRRLKQEEKLTAMDRPDFEFHEGTRLLIVIGTTDATQIAERIINALPGFGGGAAGILGQPPSLSSPEPPVPTKQ